jgi:hypothetical protein
MAPSVSGSRSVEFIFTDAEVKAVHDILLSVQRRQPAYRSLISALIVPAILLGILMAWAAVQQVSSTTFGLLIVLSMSSYLAGYLALRYEIERAAFKRTVQAYKEDPLFQGIRSIALRPDGLAFTTKAMANLYPYTAITDVETHSGLLWCCWGMPLALSSCLCAPSSNPPMRKTSF